MRMNPMAAVGRIVLGAMAAAGFETRPSLSTPVFVGSRREIMDGGKARLITRVSEEKRSRYSCEDLRKLRVARGVGPVRKIARDALPSGAEILA